MSECPKCGKENKPENAFCIGCGEPLEQLAQIDEEPGFCTGCGTPLEEDSSFCTSCGKPVGKAAANAPASSPVKPVTSASSTAVVNAGIKNRAKAGMTQEVGIPAWMVVAMAAVLIVLVAIAVYFAFGQNLAGHKDQPSNRTPQQTQTAQQQQDLSPQSAGSASDASSSVDSATNSTAQTGDSDYVLPDSNTRKYTRSELQQMSVLDLYHARNEIYARHGRGFKNEDLRQYFGAKSWYHETIAPEDFNDSSLNDIERANANLILEVEKAKGSPYLT